MTVLIDTHVWLWALESPDKLSDEALKILVNPENTILFSAASAWEIAIKTQLGKLKLPESPRDYVARRLKEEIFTELPVAVNHASRVSELPTHHKDPFDRLLIATAIEEGVPFLTADLQLKPYKIKFIWASA